MRDGDLTTHLSENILLTPVGVITDVKTKAE